MDESCQPDRLDTDVRVALLERIAREDDLLGQRTSWVVASQAFLVSAEAISLQETAKRYAATVEILVKFVPWTAIASLLLLYISIVAAVVELGKLRRVLQASGLARVVSASRIHVRIIGLAAPSLLPIVFLALWVTVLESMR
jgi:hypothetical protein